MNYANGIPISMMGYLAKYARRVDTIISMLTLSEEIGAPAIYPLSVRFDYFTDFRLHKDKILPYAILADRYITILSFAVSADLIFIAYARAETRKTPQCFITAIHMLFLYFHPGTARVAR